MTHPRTTVYFDGACPLCRREIGLLQRLDRKNRLLFKDISPPQAASFCPLPQEVMLARFHVRRADGVMFDGAAAYLTAYAQIPGLGWLGRLVRWPATLRVLDRLYALFLRQRPKLQRLAQRFERRA